MANGGAIARARKTARTAPNGPLVRAVAADEYRAELLEVQEGTPLLFVGTTAYLDDGELIEYSASYYRADRYAYSTTQTCCD